MSSSTFHDSTCVVCGSNPAEDYDLYHEYAGFPLCFKCKQIHPELYKRISKGTLQKDYLLGDHEIAHFNLNFVERPNPRGSKYAPMKLFLRYQAQMAAIQKYGSLALLDEEKSRRRNAILQRRESIYEKRLKELKRASINTDIIQPKFRFEKHVHQFKDTDEDNATPSNHEKESTEAKINNLVSDTSGGSLRNVKRCIICGLQITVETF